GCEHYERSCSIKAPCCGSFFPCRLCHDQHAPSSNGCTATLDRYSIATMICTLCELQQPASQFCQTSVGGCGQQMSAYYCDTCHLWDDDSANTGIFHCDACGMCRRGNQNDFFHCDTCGVCLSVDLRNNHRCIERSLDSDCPICGEYMQTSRRDITIAPGCGHAMHLECRQQATAAGYYQCPLCMKSAVDATGLFERLDKLVAAQPMPPEFANRRASIACNDCSEHSEVALRFDYHKC
ncbi:zf-CHY-domain-containing protein, partial [Ramicandelaber brevisporus]